LVLTKSDLAKYPFVPDATEYVKQLGLRIENIANPELKPILDRAEKRVEEALSSNPPEISYRAREDDIEILSFPVAGILAAASVNDYIKRRYALAEARRAYNLLKVENEEKVMEVAKTFNWRIRTSQEKANRTKFELALQFTDFLRNTEMFHEKEWKLVNRLLLNGEVYLTRHEAARLLQEEIRRHIERRPDLNVRSRLQDPILERVDRLKQTYASRVGEVQFEELPREVVNEAFPPCIRQLYDAAKSGRHLSHVGRFTLTSFLLNAGMEPGEVVNLFRSSSDFNERMTRYQVEHIAGDKGSRTKYIPPRCETLRTHGVCPGVDELCGKVQHSLTYYRKKLRTLKK